LVASLTFLLGRGGGLPRSWLATLVAGAASMAVSGDAGELAGQPSVESHDCD